MKRKLISNYYGFDYIDIDVPIRVEVIDGEEVEIVDIDISDIEKFVIKTIIEEKVPVGGQELKFFRKVLGLSIEEFANNFDLSSDEVFKWEQGGNERLSLVNELAVRIFVNEMLNLNIDIKFFDLDSRSTSPDKVIKLEIVNKFEDSLGKINKRYGKALKNMA